MKKNISIDFLSLAGSRTKNKIYVITHFFVLFSLIFNMSMIGVFFSASPANAYFGEIRITKETTKSTSKNFNFTGDLGNFTLKDSVTYVYNFSEKKSYTIKEAEDEEWQLKDIVCDDSYNYTADIEKRSLTLNITGNGTANCTFTNELKNDECLCDGQVSYLSLKYLGQETAEVKVVQHDGTIVFDSQVEPYTIFHMVGQTLQGTFGPEIDIFINGAKNTMVHTSCSVELYAGMLVGDFVITGGESRNNGEFCEIEPYCGDHVVSDNEECDDGNNIDGDGCNADCQYEMKKIPVKTCTGSGDLFVYQFDQLQPINTSFTSNHDQVLVFARQDADLKAQVNGTPVIMQEIASESFAKIYSISTQPGDTVTVDGTYAYNSRGVQGYLSQSNDTPVYDPDTLEVVIDDAKENYMYLTPGDYSYIFFDKYTYNNDGTNDGRVLSVAVKDGNNNIHNAAYTKPSPLPVEGVVVKDYSIVDEGNYVLSTDTKDSIYWLYSECSAPPVCGDGIKDAGESCDDGNDNDNDACNNQCEPQGELIVKKLVVGGDMVSSDWNMNIGNLLTFPGTENGTNNWLPVGMYQVSETPDNNPHYELSYNNECSSGHVTVSAGQTSTCVLTNTYVPYCGDYHVDAGEECDDGPNGSSTCSADCKIIPPECGDGKIDAGEECDDGNDNNEDSCSNECNNQGKLIVKKKVIGSNATSSDFTMHVGDSINFPGSLVGVENWLPVGMYQVAESPANLPYTLSFSEDCSSEGFVTVNKDETSSCLLTNTYEPYCGDHNVDPGEECDDGPNGSLTCSADCKTIELCEATIEGKKLDFTTDAGLSGWEIVLFDSSGLFVATSSTDTHGDYAFNNLCKGTYTVSEVVQDGWTQMSPIDPGHYTVDLTDNKTRESNKNFVNRHDVGNLKICKIEDEDGALGSTYDQTHVPDWPFKVMIGSGPLNIMTDASGCYLLSDLPAGTYEISEDDISGWIFLSPENGTTTAEVKIGETTTVNFYNQRYGDQGKICGYKYEDEDNDPQTANSKGLENWTIELSDTGHCVPGLEWADGVLGYDPGEDYDGSQLTPEYSDSNKATGEAEQDGTENYVSLGFGGSIVLSFDNLIINGEGADLEIFETSPSGTDPVNNPEKVEVYASKTGQDSEWTKLGEATLDASLDLGSMKYAKYIKLVDVTDANDFTSGENGYDLDGIRALHCRTDFTAHSSTQTDTNGHYCFYGLNDGLYRVNEVMQSGWSNTTPLSLDVLLKYGNDQEYNFNNHYPEIPEPYCGDGHLDAGEQCDDGNNVNGDGCSASCSTESGGGGGGGRVYLKIADIDAYCIAEDAVEINWRTNKTSTSWISYDKDSDAIEDADIVTSSTSSNNHSVIIDGLEPYLDYTFTAHAKQGGDTASKSINYNTDSCVEVKGEEGEPVLTIIKSTTQEFANAGDKNVPFKIIVANEGNLTAFEPVVSDTLPEGMVYSDSGETSRSWSIGDLEPGAIHELNYTVNIAPDVDPTVLVNVADVYAKNHPKVLDDADIEVLEVIVLAETGFNVTEFIGMLLSVFILFFISNRVKKFA